MTGNLAHMKALTKAIFEKGYEENTSLFSAGLEKNNMLARDKMPICEPQTARRPAICAAIPGLQARV